MSQSLVKLNNVSMRYTSRDLGGVDNINLDLKEKQNYCIIGSSGSGKTTLLKIISELIPYSSGEIEKHVCNISHNLSAHTLENDSTPVFDFILAGIHQTDNQNPLEPSPNEPSEEEINRARDLIMQWELSHRIEFSCSRLSQGEQQRMLLCQLLMKEPKLLLLDEPFSHLDPKLRHLMMQDLVDYCEQAHITFVFSTHDLDLALNFSHNLNLIHHGKIVFQGRPIDFLLKPTHLECLHYLRFHTKLLCTFSYDADSDQFHVVLNQPPHWEMKIPGLHIHQGCKIPGTSQQGLLVIAPYAWKYTSTDCSYQLAIQAIHSTYLSSMGAYQEVATECGKIWIKRDFHDLERQDCKFLYLDKQYLQLLSL